MRKRTQYEFFIAGDDSFKIYKNHQPDLRTPWCEGNIDSE
jgi:hypothetical protein